MKTAIALLALSTSLSTHAITTRHDKTAAEYEQAAAQFPAACRVTPLGSGVLIAPQWVLTAAHVGAVERMLPPEAFVVTIGEQTIPIEEFIIPDSRLGQNPMDPELPDDIALVKLAHPVEGIEPLKPVTSPIADNLDVWIVGSGILASGDTGKEFSPALMQDPTRDLRAATNTLSNNPDDPATATFDLSSPDDNATDLEGGTNVGDSGGPVLVQIGDTVHVAGVISHMDTATENTLGTYGDVTTVTLTSAYIEWINKTTYSKE
ncbi:MAG: trypsin-like serine protease [Planctomycetota bacterium]|jgi:hypothetical protein